MFGFMKMKLDPALALLGPSDVTTSELCQAHDAQGRYAPDDRTPATQSGDSVVIARELLRRAAEQSNTQPVGYTSTIHLTSHHPGVRHRQITLSLAIEARSYRLKVGPSADNAYSFTKI